MSRFIAMIICFSIMFAIHILALYYPAYGLGCFIFLATYFVLVAIKMDLDEKRGDR